MKLGQMDLFGSLINARFFAGEGDGGAGGGGTPPAATPPATPPAAPPATPPAATPPVGETFDFHKVIGPDGKLMEGWKAGLPEEVRHEISLDTFGTVGEMARQYVNAQKMIGKDKIVIPGEKATPAEINAFHERLGRPKSPEEYKIDIKPEFKDYFDEGLIGSAKKMAFELGLNQKQMARLINFREEEVKAGLQAMEAQEQLEFEEAERAIMQESGESLDAMKELANRCIADNCPDEAKRAKILEMINDNAMRPLMFGFLADIQKKYFAEHGGMPTGDASGVMAPKALEEKAKELMATSGYLDGTMKNSNPAQYERLTREITELYNRADKAVKAAQNAR